MLKQQLAIDGGLNKWGITMVSQGKTEQCLTRKKLQYNQISNLGQFKM